MDVKPIDRKMFQLGTARGYAIPRGYANSLYLRKAYFDIWSLYETLCITFIRRSPICKSVLYDASSLMPGLLYWAMNTLSQISWLRLKKRVFVCLQYMSLSRRICQYQKVQYWQLWGKYIQPVDSLQYDNLVTCFVISSLYCFIWPHKLKIIQKYKIIKIIPPLRNGPPDLLWLSADHWEGDWCDTGFSKSPEPTINGLG